VNALLAALRNERPQWHTVTAADLAAVLAQSGKRRFEMADGRIRALYGHSVPRRLEKTLAPPPGMVYHGTSRRVVAAIMAEGLRPVGRQYIHLSADTRTARQVAARKPGRSVILAVSTAEATRHGTIFYRGNEQVWLADVVPPAFIGSHQGAAQQGRTNRDNVLDHLPALPYTLQRGGNVAWRAAPT
jgi:putative RNA 2'-phosphotransferase